MHITPKYIDFLPADKKRVEKTKFVATLKNIYNGQIPNNLESWIDFVNDFQFYNSNGNFAYTMSLPISKHTKIEFLKQNLDLGLDGHIKRENIVVSASGKRYNLPIDANMNDVLALVITLDKAIAEIADPKSSSACSANKAKTEIEKVLSKFGNCAFSKTSFTATTGLSLFVPNDEKHKIKINSLKSALIANKVLPPETRFKKYRLGKTFDEACRVLEKKLHISQQEPSLPQPTKNNNEIVQ